MIRQFILSLCAVTLGVAGFLFLCRSAGASVSGWQPPALWISAVISMVVVLLSAILLGSGRQALGDGVASVFLLAAAGAFMASATIYHLIAYVRLPADILSFSESAFVNHILQFRLGMPLYTPPADNNSSVYTPGAPILTYLFAAAFGYVDSIPVFRVVQLCYVILASIVATSICDLLARLFLPPAEYRQRFLWMAAFWPFLFLVCFDGRFNLYNHSLHNDGLALLVSIVAMWLMVKYAMTRRAWLLAVMAVLPALGFLVKQNQLMWLGVFLIYFVILGEVPWRQLLLFLVFGAIFALTAFGICYLLWGQPFFWWTFTSLGSKEVSILRAGQHLLQGGLYAIMGLFGGWVFVLRNGSRTAAALWLSWVIVFAIQTYTSGFAWQANHMGPGVVIAACWFLAAVRKVWPRRAESQYWWQYRGREAMAVCALFLLFGALGLFREPRNPVPADFSRYVQEIEREFEGHDARRILMDYGTWVYMEDQVVMKDRGVAVAVHVGTNQPTINHAMLAATIKRIENKCYDKILARQLDTGESAYDYQDRGSGVKAAIYSNYKEVRRIPAVDDVYHWWPMHLVSEIIVLVPKR